MTGLHLPQGTLLLPGSLHHPSASSIAQTLMCPILANVSHVVSQEQGVDNRLAVELSLKST